jgi:hypothetical protein
VRLPTCLARPSRAEGALAAALLVLVTGLVGAVPAAAQPLTADSVTVSVLSVTPSTPAAANTPTALTITLQLTNTSDETLDGLVVTADRGDPIDSQRGLDSAIAKPSPPDPSLDSPVKDAGTGGPLQVTASLAAGGSAPVVLATTSSLQTDQGLCICAAAAIYPIWFTVSYTDQTGTTSVVGTGQTLVPAFDQAPQKVQVSWLWPIIEPPHRLASDDVFTDDELATSVATGRLSRVLQVADAVTAESVPLTLVVDPETIDELAVMSTGRYSVQSGGRTLAGTGGAAATAWLATLRAVVARPGVELELTPPADPDVESLSDNGLGWDTTLTAAAQARVLAVLGAAGRTDIAWPYDQTLDGTALAAVVRAGAKTVVLSDSTLAGATASNGSANAPQPSALTQLQTTAGPVLAAVTSSSIERYVATVLAGPAGTVDLPKLVAEVAIRAVEAPAEAHFVVITPPRNVDPSVPGIAAQAILDTAATSWSAPIGLDAATATATPVARGALASSAGGTGGLSATLLTAVSKVASLQTALTSMLSPVTATAQLGWVPEALQRLKSAAWRDNPAQGVALSATVLQRLASLQAGVYIKRPSSRNYTLGSSNSPLPLLVVNTLPYPVKVRVSVSTVNGLPGFTAKDANIIEIGARATSSLRIATHVQRTGRFAVEAVLLTPSGTQLGSVVPLSIHSTALGVIGVVITIVAGVVLVLALLVRAMRRLRRHANPEPGPAEREPVPVP